MLERYIEMLLEEEADEKVIYEAIREYLDNLDKEESKGGQA